MSYFTKKFDEKVVELLKGGAVGFMPSDTVYGLSARALDETAVDKIYQVKQRDNGKPCIILLSSVEQVAGLGVEPKVPEPIKEFWPAPLTFIAPANDAPEYLQRGLNSLAIRIPDNQALRGLIAETGPLVSTSANIQDEPIAHTPKHAEDVFGENLDFYVDVGELSGTPSTIVKLSGNHLEVVRQGAWQIPA